MPDTPGRSELPAELQQSIAQSRKAFVAAMTEVRPRLHKFCARMCGSVFDGEDIVQEALADAFYNLASLRDATKFESWLFRIAYNKCADHLRRTRERLADETFDDEHDLSSPTISHASAFDEASDVSTDAALRALVSGLPPKERAAVLLKDVLDYSLSETADVIDSTVAGVKAALHRARTKLAEQRPESVSSNLDDSDKHLYLAYADIFNNRDWEGLSRLIRADARLEIVGEVRGDMRIIGPNYHTNYLRLPWEWRLSVEEVDSQLAIVHHRRVNGEWQRHSAILLTWADDQLVEIKDYVHVDYLFATAPYPTE